MTRQRVVCNRCRFRPPSPFLRVLAAVLLLALTGCFAEPPPVKSSAATTDAANDVANDLKRPSSLASSGAREVRVAAASDLKYALDQVIGACEKEQSEFRVKATYGSSGAFFAQLSNEAPFDVFLSADVDYPRKLVAMGHGVADSLFIYARGHLVAWVPNDSTLDLDAGGFDELAGPKVRKLAIANPKFAPYGRAAQAALRSLGLLEKVESRLVLGDNVAQTAQFAETGSADVALVALSLALAPAMRDKGRYRELPLESYPRLEQGGVILSNARDREAADEFCRFLQGQIARDILARFGFILPES